MANHLCSLHRLLFFLVLLIYTESLEPPFKLVCYYTNWGIYRPGLAKYTPQNINPYLCTHLIYAFGGLSTRFEIKPFDAYNDIQQGNFKKFVDLKKHNPDLKTMIAVGGWNEGSKKFSAMVAESENRKKFVKSVMKFLRQHKFDGLDLDWEYPTFRDGGNPEDKEGYASLVQELRAAFDDEQLGKSKKKLLLTMAVPAGSQYIDQGYDVPSLARNLDFFNLLTYDYYTAEEPTVRHHSPLYEVGDFEDWDVKKQYNCDFTVNYYIDQGVPPSKIVLGIPTYGRAFTLDGEDTEYDSAAKGAAEAGPATREAGYLAYHEICKNIKEKEWEVKKPFPEDMGPYAFKGDQWVGYDDVDIVTIKAKYVVDHKLGGAMFWSLDTDDFRGSCGGEKSPLISAARRVLFSAKAAESAANDKPTKSPAKRTTTKRPTTTTTTTTTTEAPEPEIEELVEEEQELSDIPELHEEEQRVDDNKREARDRQDQDSASSCHFGTKSGGRRSSKTGCASAAEEEVVVEEEEDVNAAASEDRQFTTPEPPTTPDPGPQFVCTDEGFFINPTDCKKYFWCLDSGPAELGVIPHHFTCPSGLYFNKRTDSCDYPTNVQCKQKVEIPLGDNEKPARGRATTARTTKRKSSRATTTPEPEVVVEEEEEATTEQRPRTKPTAKSETNIAQLLTLIEKLGGVEEVQKHLQTGGEVPPITGSDRRPSARSKSVRTKEETAVDEEEVAATTRRAKATTTTEIEQETVSAPPRRRPALRRTTTTTETPTTTKSARRQPSVRRKVTTTEETQVEDEPTTSRSRRRQTTTTTTTVATEALRAPSRRRTTTTTSPDEDALVDNSRQSTTVQKFQQVDKNVDEVEDKPRTPNSKSGVEKSTTTFEMLGIDVEVTDKSDLETHTFGATRIPGLFNYVLVQRNGTSGDGDAVSGGASATTEEDGPVSSQLKRILDAHEAKETTGRQHPDELTAVPSTVTTKVDRQGAALHRDQFSEEGAESTANVREVTSNGADTARPNKNAAPFENIGISLVDGDLPTSENKPQEVRHSEDQLSVRVLPSELPPTQLQEQTPPPLPVEEPLYYDEYEEELPATDAFPPETTTQQLDTTTTIQLPSTTEQLPETTTAALEVETTTPRRRPPLRIGGTRPPTTTTSTTTTARPTVAPPRVSAPRRPASTPRPEEEEEVHVGPTKERGPASSLLDTSNAQAAVDRDIPVLSPVRVHQIRRPSGEQQGDSSFEGIIVNQDGEIECLEQGVYPHPQKCDRFISCISEQGNTKPYSYMCPPGQLYDDFTGRCLGEEQVECNPLKK